MAGEGWEQRAWLARIRTGPGGGTCGAGFLVDAEHVVTCAHVVQQAGAAGPGGRVFVDFPQLTDPGCWAEVLTDGWAEEAGTRGDTAVLRLTDPPAGACPVPMRAVTSVHGQPFAVYGFPAGYDDAEVASEGRLGHAVGREWVQLEVASSLLVEPGYSGGAVWSDELRAVVALLVSRDAGTAGRVAFAVPIRVLAKRSAVVTAALPTALELDPAREAGEQERQNRLRQLAEFDQQSRTGGGVFISYSHADSNVVDVLARRFERDRIDYWRDDKDLYVGDVLDKAISRGIHENFLFLILLTPSSISSAWVERELDEAAHEETEGRKVVLPVLAKGLSEERIPARLRRKFYVDLSNNFDDGYARLVRSIQHHIPRHHLHEMPSGSDRFLPQPHAPPRRPAWRLWVVFGIATMAVVLVVLLVARLMVPSRSAHGKVRSIAVGGGVSNIALSPSGRYCYVTQFKGNQVSVIDTKTEGITATIPSAGGPIAVALSPNGRRAYVSHWGSRDVAVVDTTTDKVIANVNVGSVQWGIAVAPDRAYVALRGSGTVAVIDTTANTVTARIRTSNSPSDNPVEVALTSDWRRVYATNRGSASVSIIDTAMNKLVATIPADAGPNAAPNGVAVTHDGRYVLATNEGADTVSRITAATGQAISIAVGGAPVTVAVSRDGGHAYVVNRGSRTVSAIDVTRGVPTATLDLGGDPGGIALAPDGRHLYIANAGLDAITVIDTSGLTHA